VLLKENETWELINMPVNSKVIQNRWVEHKVFVTATLALRLNWL
jgi:hypothetical protein